MNEVRLLKYDRIRSCNMLADCNSAGRDRAGLRAEETKKSDGSSVIVGWTAGLAGGCATSGAEVVLLHLFSF